MATIEKVFNQLEQDKWAAFYQKCVKENETDRILKAKNLQRFSHDPKERLNIKVDLEGFSEAAKQFMCWAILYGRSDRIVHGSISIFLDEIEGYWGKSHARGSMFNALKELEQADYIETLYKTRQGSCYLLKV